ncbi:hypothetical protein J3F84DRAFT_370829 [Trichoderma pleuroticola]
MGPDPADIASAVMGTQVLQRATGWRKPLGQVLRPRVQTPCSHGLSEESYPMQPISIDPLAGGGEYARETACQRVSGLVWQATKAKKGAPNTFVRVHEST